VSWKLNSLIEWTVPDITDFPMVLLATGPV